MRILIISPATEEEKKHRISIRIPNTLAFSRVVATFASKRISKSKEKGDKYKKDKDIQPITSAQLMLLFKELRRVSRHYKGLELVNVESASGERVLIKI